MHASGHGLHQSRSGRTDRDEVPFRFPLQNRLQMNHNAKRPGRKSPWLARSSHSRSRKILENKRTPTWHSSKIRSAADAKKKRSGKKRNRTAHHAPQEHRPQRLEQLCFWNTSKAGVSDTVTGGSTCSRLLTRCPTGTPCPFPAPTLHPSVLRGIQCSNSNTEQAHSTAKDVDVQLRGSMLTAEHIGQRNRLGGQGCNG